MRLTDIFKFKLFDRTDKADLDVVNENFQNVETALNNCKQDLSNHKSSGDHDSRYLQKSAVINNNTTTEAGYALDARQANPNVSGSLGAQINSLNTNLSSHKTSGDHDSRYYIKNQVDEKNFLKVLKSDWSTNVGNIRAFFDANTNLTTFGGEIVLNDGTIIYSPIKSARADADADGNNIPNTYLKKNYVRSNIKSVNRNEYNKYFNNTWSYSGPEGAEIDAGTWLIHYYAWFSNVSGISFISIKSALDEAVGATAPVTSNGTFLEMHEISVGRNTGLPIMVYVPSPVTFGQYVSKVVAIKLGD